MDCEKFEETLIDELYDELDELTSAAAKRHAAGCSKCAALLNGLRATRKVAVLPVVMPPPDLEERILAAARDARKVVPLRSRVGNVVSWAGGWAMRPQTAMAAVFLLAIGSSFVLMRSKSEMAPATVRVRAEGSPVAAATASAQGDQLDTTSAAGAHGTEEKQRAAATPVLLPPADMPGASATTGSDLDGLLAGNGTGLGRNALAKDDWEGDKSKIANAAPPAGAPAPPMATATAAAEAQIAGGGGGYGGGATATTAAGKAGPADFTTAMNAYRARRFVEATGAFDSLSAADANAALWAARSVREGQGCAAAVGRFDQVTNRAFGSTPGYEATLDAGRCYADMGNSAVARQRFSSLLSVPAYADRAQGELDKMSPQAAKKPASRSADPAPVQAAPAHAADSPNASGL